MINPVYVTVETWLMDEDASEPESVRTIDHNNKDDRIWLGRHSFWALRNGREVITTPN